MYQSRSVAGIEKIRHDDQDNHRFYNLAFDQSWIQDHAYSVGYFSLAGDVDSLTVVIQY
jgi:hypothetical protein